MNDTVESGRPQDERIVAAPRVCWGMLENNLLLFGHHDRHLHVLNSTAAMVWAMTDEPILVSTLISSLSDEYDVEPSEIEDDVLMVVDRLLESDLCLVEGAAAAAPELPDRLPSAINYQPEEGTLGPFNALGARVFVDVGDARLSAELKRALAPLADLSLGPGAPTAVYTVRRIREGFNLFVNDRVLTRGTARSKCFRAIMSDINATAIGFIDDAVVLHASAAEINGSIIAFPGVSNSGKSTLVAKLLMRGHGYVTDEALVVGGGELNVTTFHKSICIDRGSQRQLMELEPASESKARDATWDIDPRTIGDGKLSEGGSLKALVFPIFRPDSANAELRRIEPIEAMHRLLANSFDFEIAAQSAFAVLVRMTNWLPAYELAHGGEGHIELLEALDVSEVLESAVSKT